MLRYSLCLTSFFTFRMSCHADRLCPCLHQGSEFNIANRCVGRSRMRNGFFQDQVSGIVNTRPNLNQALNFARPGDTLVVWRLDRLSRSLRDLIETVTLLESRGVQLKSLHESIDTASSSGKLIFHLFGLLRTFRPLQSIATGW